MFQASTHLTNARRLFDCVSSSVYRSPYFRTVLNADGRVNTVCAFFTFFPHTSFYNLTHLCIPFFSFLWFLPFFYIVLFLYSHLYAHLFHRPQFYSSVNFIRRNYLLVCFSFHSFQSSRNVRLLTTHIPRYSPRVVVIMLILSTSGWCPLNVISSKISVFLSTDSQSIGSLTFNSHVLVFALFSPLITVAVMKRKRSLNDFFNVQIKASII